MTQTIAKSAAAKPHVNPMYRQWTLRLLIALVAYHKKEFPRGTKSYISISDTDGNYHFLKFEPMKDTVKNAVALCVDRSDNVEYGENAEFDKSRYTKGMYHAWTLLDLQAYVCMCQSEFPLGLDTPVHIADTEGNYHFTKAIPMTDKVKTIRALCLSVERGDNDVC